MYWSFPDFLPYQDPNPRFTLYWELFQLSAQLSCTLARTLCSSGSPCCAEPSFTWSNFIFKVSLVNLVKYSRFIAYCLSAPPFQMLGYFNLSTYGLVNFWWVGIMPSFVCLWRAMSSFSMASFLLSDTWSVEVILTSFLNELGFCIKGNFWVIWKQ